MKKKVLAILLAAALVGGLMGFAATAQTNQPTVTFDAATEKFTFENADAYEGETNPDLFTDAFKGMMPGDTATTTITVKVVNAGKNTVKMSLKADTNAEKNPNAHPTNKDYKDHVIDPGSVEPPAADPQEPGTVAADPVLNVITLEVKHGENTYTGTLGQGVDLGSFTGDAGATELEVTASIPLTVGNELEDVVAKLGWVFTAEVIEPAPTPPPSGPIIPDNPPALNKVDHFAYIVGYPDGNVKPQGNITRAEVATIFFRMLTDESRNEFWSQNSGYSDVTINKWFNNAISTLANGGILTGYADGTFKPNANITRAEFATMAVRFFSSSYDGEDLFPDINKHWAKDYINTAAKEGIINGYEDGTFRPDQPITRAEAMTIVNRVLERHPDKDHLLKDMIQWPDNMDTDKWYYADVQEATNSHDYDMKGTEAEPYEVWSKMLPVRDWVAFEKEWSDANSAQGGEVVK